MSTLANQSLASCTHSSTTLTNDDINQYLSKLNSWHANIENDSMRITKIYKFKNYARALTFANNIAILAEQENHHPRMCIEWGKVTISWWTHSLNGLFINDFIMAARCDETYTE